MRLAVFVRSAMCIVASVVVTGSVWAQDAAQPVRYDDHSLVEATVKSWAEIGQMESWGIIPLDCHIHVGTGNFIASPDALARMTDAGIKFNVLIDDVQPLLDAERERLQQGGVAAGAWFADFKNFAAIETYMDSLMALEPDLISKIVVGTTHEGRTIHGYRISGSPGIKPAVLFNGTQHAREWVSPMVNVYLADQFVKNYDTDPTIQNLLDDIEVFIIPVVNPDGYVYSWDFERFWRKNRRDNGGGSWGVDLNRNWTVDWNGGESTSTNPDSEVYVGPGPLSEPESQALAAFVQARPQIVAHIDFHSYQQVILRTWGYTNSLPPDIDQINDLGADMNNAIFGVHGFNYPHGGGGDLLYLASGILPDWMYGENDVFSWTIELRPCGGCPGGFELPPDQILPTAQENFQAALVLATFAQAEPTLGFSFPSGRPDVLVPNTPTTVAVDIESNFGAQIVGGTELVYTRVGNTGPFTPTTMTPLGGQSYEATLPGVACGQTLEYYFEVENDLGEVFTSPDDAPASLYSALSVDVEVLTAEDFQTDPGWSVSGNPADGAWEIGVPVGGGDRSDPPTDYDGSGACYLTDNVDGNSDVDDGVTILTTVPYDLTGDAEISWAFWLNDETNPMGGEDYFIVEMATDAGGTNWQQVRDYNAAPFWQTDVLTVSGADATATVRLRFSVADLGQGDVIEAGLDDFVVSRSGCDDPDPCLGDADGDGEVAIADLLGLLAAWGTNDPLYDIAPDGGDGNVDVQDLLVMLAAWGPCP